MRRVLTDALILGAAAAIAAGCGQFRPPSGGGAQAEAPRRDCAYLAAIEDGEDGDDRVLTRSGRGGFLYTYMDESGTTLAPAGDFTMASPGAAGTQRALRMHGTLADAGEVYAGMGFSFTEPEAAYDASRFTGIAFSAKRAPESAAWVRMKVPDVHTDPDGGVCTECYNDFGIDFEVHETWTRYEVAFADLTQQVGWGEPRPETLDSSKLFGMQWQVAEAGAAVDVWVDEITFTGCGETR